MEGATRGDCKSTADKDSRVASPDSMKEYSPPSGRQSESLQMLDPSESATDVASNDLRVPSLIRKQPCEDSDAFELHSEEKAPASTANKAQQDAGQQNTRIGEAESLRSQEQSTPMQTDDVASQPHRSDTATRSSIRSGNDASVDVELNNRDAAVEKAVRFIRHPRLTHISMAAKNAYLTSKGLTPVQIRAANASAAHTYNLEDSVWNEEAVQPTTQHSSFENTQRQASQDRPEEVNSNEEHLENAEKKMPPHGKFTSNPKLIEEQRHNPDMPAPPHLPPLTGNLQHVSNAPHYFEPNFARGMQTAAPLPEPPGILVPATIGGMLAIFGLATIRWLNGGDFVLFPPAAQAINLEGDMHMSEQMNLAKGTAATFPTTGLEKAINDEAFDANENENDHVGRRSISDIVQTIGTDDSDENKLAQCRQDEDSTSDATISNSNLLAQEIAGLTSAIEKLSLLQECSLRDATDKKAKETTNRAMDFLRQYSSSTDRSNRGILEAGPEEAHGSKLSAPLQLSDLVQLAELKCGLQSLRNELLDEDNKGIVFSKTNTCLTNGSITDRLDSLTVLLEKITLKFDEPDVAAKTERKDESVEETETAKECGNVLTIKLPDVDTPTVSTTASSELRLPTGLLTRDHHNETSPLEATGFTADCEVNSLHATSKSQATNNEAKAVQSVGFEALSLALRRIAEENDATQVKSGAQMLFLYINNLYMFPTEQKYRKIFTNSSTFKNKVDKVVGAKDVLYAVGFVDEGATCLTWSTLKPDDTQKLEGATMDLLSSESESMLLLKEAVSALTLLKNSSTYDDV